MPGSLELNVPAVQRAHIRAVRAPHASPQGSAAPARSEAGKPLFVAPTQNPNGSAQMSLICSLRAHRELLPKLAGALSSSLYDEFEGGDSHTAEVFVNAVCARGLYRKLVEKIPEFFHICPRGSELLAAVANLS